MTSHPLTGSVLAVLSLVLGLQPTSSSAQAGPTPTSSLPARCTATPFLTSVPKRMVYRIPALVATPRGTLVAFAERRRSTAVASDLSDTEVVVARSVDRGCHWTAPRVVADSGTDTVGNPAPVVDTTTGTVLLLTVDRPRVGRPSAGPGGRGLHLQRSTDDGLTFTSYADARLDLAHTPGWKGGLTGPGHAIQLHNPASPHRGRIVVPLGYKSGDRYGTYGLVSDDHGVHWSVGYHALTVDARIEGTVAELADGRLWVSYHSRGPAAVGRGRVGAYSLDGGRTLTGPFRRAGLPVVSVQGSALALTGTHAGVLLYSSPAGQDPRRRHQMALFASRGATAGRGWAAPYDVQLDSRPASYSDLVQLDDGSVGVLYETGRTSWHERIVFRSLDVADVLAPTRTAARLTVTVPRRVRAGRAPRPTLLVRVAGATSPAGDLRVRLSGPGVNRTQTLALMPGSSGTRVVTLGRLAKGRYRLQVRYSGTARITGVTRTVTITAD
ncbi:exo-alpha-sialidase [uncultured Friedmanniella sp.]|uniref:sialidase family protein n=1 Tax=uncultured Friedmanniella sp. TaxID=335381 RepID=UPI0035C9A90C